MRRREDRGAAGLPSSQWGIPHPYTAPLPPLSPIPPHPSLPRHKRLSREGLLRENSLCVWDACSLRTLTPMTHMHVTPHQPLPWNLCVSLHYPPTRPRV